MFDETHVIQSIFSKESRIKEVAGIPKDGFMSEKKNDESSRFPAGLQMLISGNANLDEFLGYTKYKDFQSTMENQAKPVFRKSTIVRFLTKINIPNFETSIRHPSCVYASGMIERSGLVGRVKPPDSEKRHAKTLLIWSFAISLARVTTEHL